VKFEKKLGNNRVMPIREHVRLHEHALARRALDGVATAIDLGTDRFNDDARRRSFLFDLFIQA
jgi:hypothetical protein